MSGWAVAVIVPVSFALVELVVIVKLLNRLLLQAHVQPLVVAKSAVTPEEIVTARPKGKIAFSLPVTD